MNKFFAVILFLIFTLFSNHLISQNFDVNLLKPINKNETNFKNNYFLFNTKYTATIGIGIPTGIAILGFIKKDKFLQRDALYMGGAFIVSSIITKGTKHIFNRNRPFETYTFIIKRDDENGGLSFPSGHATAAFTTATSIAMRYKKWYFVVPSYIFASSVAWARMYQGVHYPSDVFAGAIVGAGSAWLGYKMQQWITTPSKKQKQSYSLL